VRLRQDLGGAADGRDHHAGLRGGRSADGGRGPQPSQAACHHRVGGARKPAARRVGRGGQSPRRARGRRACSADGSEWSDLTRDGPQAVACTLVSGSRPNQGDRMRLMIASMLLAALAVGRAGPAATAESGERFACNMKALTKAERATYPKLARALLSGVEEM